MWYRDVVRGYRGWGAAMRCRDVVQGYRWNIAALRHNSAGYRNSAQRDCPVALRFLRLPMCVGEHHKRARAGMH